MTARTEAAATFHRLHRGPDILLLANAWDAGSARVIESLGAKAIATTSAGVAWALGYPDGDALPARLLAASVATIARAIRVPLTVDVEGGYASDPAAVGEAVAGIVDAGAVGINIEDGSGPPDLLCAKIVQAKQAAARRGVALFVNARIDVYLRQLVPEAARVAEAIARAKRYRDAGADGIFVPGVIAADEIRPIAAAVDRPLNVMVRPGLAPAAELATLGVRRLSAGSAIAQVVLGRAAALAETFLREGRSDLVTEGAMPYPRINALFARDPTDHAILGAAEPQLFVSDIAASCAFFERLGFAVAFVYGDPPFYGQVRRDGAALNLRHVDAPLFDNARRARDDLLSASITVDAITALYAEFQAAGTPFHQTLRTEPWGARTFIVKDPDGNLLLFAGPTG